MFAVTQPTTTETPEQPQQLQQPSGKLSKEDVLQAFRLNRMKQMKLERMTRYNEKLKQELKQDRIKASNASLMAIDYMETHEDKLLPEIWGPVEDNRYKGENGKRQHMEKQSHPGEGKDGACCSIM